MPRFFPHILDPGYKWPEYLRADKIEDLPQKLM